MSSIERLVAAIFLAGAVAGAAAFGHLLGSEPAAPTGLVSLLPAASPSRGIAVQAEPAPPLPAPPPSALLPALLPELRPLRVRAQSTTTRPDAPAAGTPARQTQPSPRPVTSTVTSPVTKPAQPAATPAPASAPAAAPVAPLPVAPRPAPTPPPAAAPALPAVQVVLAATEQVVAPDQQTDDDDNHDGGGRGEHGGHGQGDDN